MTPTSGPLRRPFSTGLSSTQLPAAAHTMLRWRTLGSVRERVQDSDGTAAATWFVYGWSSNIPCSVRY